MFSKACEYAIRATIYIAEQSQLEKRVGIKEISKAIDSPEAFTAKILQQLSKSNIIDSLKGPTGGFLIENNKIKKLRLNDIVLAIDGDSIFKGCGLGFKQCSEKKPCPVHHKFKKIRDELCSMLENTTVQELSSDLKKGITFLHR
ncbi:MAG: Rrf2 family transcriptional regulator [Bacteroidia bacterium]|nr:Rrf2 family transcriptional regulator [Bacteroidia bacterium]